jgi:deoxyribonuclease V
VTIPFVLPASAAEAREIQEGLRHLVMLRDDFPPPATVAGVDVHFPDRRTARAAVVLLSLPELTVIERSTAETPLSFPSVPGLLSFREIPALLAALARLRQWPDLLLLDGQGYAHPRRLGLACHAGLVTGIPSIGCAKSRLIGEHGEPGPRRGDRSYLTHGGEVIGVVLRTRDRVRPVFVSPGHRVCLSTAAALCLAWARRRVPEPTRLAHQYLG